jgi:hypothetical protein
LLFVFPPNTRVIARRRYERPYPDPIHVQAGDIVDIDRKQTQTTDLFGWLWCRGPDGREGWTPEAWLSQEGDRAHITSDFSALELEVEAGERLTALFSESGFIFSQRENGEQGWVPDGLVDLEPGR